MEVYIFLTDAEFDCLFKAVPPVSIARLPLDRFRSLQELGYQTGSNIGITCTTEQARDLVFHAEVHCKAAADKTRHALREAGSEV